MESLLNFQEEIFGRISKGRSNFRKSPKERITKEYLEGRLELLDQLWLEFLSGHKEIMRKISSSREIAETNYAKNKMFDQGEDVYFEYKCELKTALSALTIPDSDQTSGPSHSNLCNVKLPTVNIPNFSGQYSEWNTFRDLFKSLVHSNSDLDDVQKLLYLKGYLTGEAEQLLSNIPITDKNYSRCWKLLDERYNNKRYICHHILKRLMSQKNINQESASSLKELMDTTNDCLSALANIGVNTDTWDVLVIHIIVLKLDPESRRQWEFDASNSSDELPTYKQFREFLTKRYRALEFLDSRSNSAYKNTSHLPVHKTKAMHIAKIQCPFCSGEHKLIYCKAFIKTSIESRRGFVQSNNICYCCLGNNHTAKNCQTNYRCRICNKKHNALLHPTSEGAPKSYVPRTPTTDSSTVKDTKPKSSSANGDKSESTPVLSCFTRKTNHILLATALVNIVSKTGQCYTIRTLLDQGSQSSFITEATVQLLGLNKTPTKTQISGVGGDKGLISKGIVNLKIMSRVDPNVIINVKAHVLKSITTLLPTSEIKAVEWKELQEMVLADPDYHMPNHVDMLLGADVYGQILQDGVIKGPYGSPVAQATSLGWILSGALDAPNEKSEIKVMHMVEDNNLLKRFWELEDDVPMSKEKLQTEDEKCCEEIFTKTTTRDEDGRYVVRLPFKVKNPEVTNSLQIAEKRLYSLERRLRTGDLKEKYKEVINEYIKMNHMELIPKEDINNVKSVYLAHHAVVRNDKETSKIRPVFDASCKGANNVSLNDNLLVGPTLQVDLKHLIMRWRIARICLTADIVKMYRQVKVNGADVDFQRILWRNDTDEKIKHYRMLRVTFGIASAPYLAVKALRQVSLDEGHKYPIAAKAVLNQFYMDDLLAGCETVEEGMKLYREMNGLLEKGGFELQKWTSNSEELLQEMKESERKVRKEFKKEEIKEGLKIKTDETIKIVGLTWNRSDDSFRYKVDLPEVQEPATKRIIISNICRLYDPIGWVGPSIILTKILIQKLWLAGLDWDETVPTNILNEWKTYQEELKLLTNVSIPRWIGIKTGDFVELHGFSDSSKDAYAAVVYARVVDSNGQIHVSLISAKTKVAPIKQVSIPRLELCGAVLLTRLMMEIASVMEIEKTHLHAWTDSTVVLAWLNSHPSRWKVFVANRVSEIVTNLDAHHWSHVSSKNNPADAASRGQNPSELIKNAMWFAGPDFLKKENIDYKKPKDIGTNIEEVQIKTHCATVVNCIWERFSSLNKMIRVIAYCRRFVHNLKKDKIERHVGYLTTQELNDAINCCIRQCQIEYFSEEIAMVKKNDNLPKQSSLRALNPFLDDDQLLRIGDRLEHFQLSKNRRQRILTLNKYFVTNLLVMDAHKLTSHGGPQLTLYYLSKFYKRYRWPSQLYQSRIDDVGSGSTGRQFTSV